MVYISIAPKHGLLVELVTTSACHAEGHGFESRTGRHKNFIGRKEWNMIVFLIITIKAVIMCIPGVKCIDYVGDPTTLIVSGGFEFFAEILGMSVYRKIIRKKE